MLVVTAFSVARTRSLFAIVALSGVFSLLSALLFIAWDAVDVAFTEAAVGAGISTVLMLGTLALTSRAAKITHKSKRAKNYQKYQKKHDIWCLKFTRMFIINLTHIVI